MNDTSTTHAERLTAACALSIEGGFLDIYTYLYRGNVFANAVTGNMVLFGLNLAELQWHSCIKYLLAILFYALGVFTAEYVHWRLPNNKRIGWHQSVLMLEIICLLPVVFVPYGDFDYAINALIAFVCALQVQTFRRVRGLPFASTMCTGNLRSGTEALFYCFSNKNRAELSTAMYYYLMIACFIAGAAVGAVLLRLFGHFVFLLAPLGLIAVFFLITNHRQLVTLRKTYRGLFRKNTR